MRVAAKSSTTSLPKQLARLRGWFDASSVEGAKSRWKKFARSVTGGEPQAKTKNLIARQSKRRDKEDERRGGAAHASLAGSALAQPKQVRIVCRDRGGFTVLVLFLRLL